MAEIGYEWKPAHKRKPRAFEILKFRKAGGHDDKEYFACWNGERFFVFDIYSGRWKTLEQKVFAYPEENVRMELLGWEYAYIPKDQTRYIPFWAIAFSRLKEVKDGENR